MRSCGDCLSFMYDDEPGRMGGVRIDPRTEKPYPRLGRTPCSYCPKQKQATPVKDRTPRTAIDLSDRNWAAWQHYSECRATNHFPDDWIVRRNAAIIHAAEEMHKQITLAKIAMIRGLS